MFYHNNRKVTNIAMYSVTALRKGIQYFTYIPLKLVLLSPWRWWNSGTEEKVNLPQDIEQERNRVRTQMTKHHGMLTKYPSCLKCQRVHLLHPSGCAVLCRFVCMAPGVTHHLEILRCWLDSCWLQSWAELSKTVAGLDLDLRDSSRGGKNCPLTALPTSPTRWTRARPSHRRQAGWDCETQPRFQFLW